MNARRSVYLLAPVLVWMLASCRSAPVVLPTSTLAPTPTLAPDRLIGRPIHGDETDVYRMMEDGRIRFISDWLTFLALGYQPNDLVTIPTPQLRSYPLASPLTRWITGTTDRALYFLQKGERYKIADAGMLATTGGTPLWVSLVPDQFLNSFPLATQPLLGTETPAPIQASVTAALRLGNAIWIARDDRTLVRLRPQIGQREVISIPGAPVIDSLAVAIDGSYAATRDGAIWQITARDQVYQVVNAAGSRLGAMASDGTELWYTDVGYYDFAAGGYHAGRGLIHHAGGGAEQVYTLDLNENDPLRNITALALDSKQSKLWIGTRFSGLVSFDLKNQSWQRYNLFNKGVPDNQINDLVLTPDGSLWLAMPAGLCNFSQNNCQVSRVPDDVTDKGVLALTAAADGSIWAAGENYVGRFSQGTWQLYSAFDHTSFMDTFRRVVQDDQGSPWFIGDQQMVHSDGQTWSNVDPQSLKAAPVVPGSQAANAKTVTFPAPQTDYQGWLKAWPRPADDNGRGMHYLAAPSNETFELRQQIIHLKQLHVRWLLVNYTSRSQLPRMAKAFTEAGITVIWRPFVRPYREYPYWAKDIGFLRALGLPPYIQVYNEPSLGQEWEDAHLQVDQAVYLNHVLPALRQVYEAGGYVGLQEIDLDWLRVVLRKMKDDNEAEVFSRLFFIPHAYGYNHPPDFDKDVNSVLGFRDFAKVFQDEMGFIPMMVAGEGGWRPGEAQDPRYPMVTQTLHRDYFLSIFKWFRTGKLSNGEPLPDYFFAFCPWILSDPTDPAAWFDSAAGDRILTIQAIEKLPDVRRKFSWESP